MSAIANTAVRTVLVATLVIAPVLDAPNLARAASNGAAYRARVLLLILRRRRRGCVDVVETPRHEAPLPPVLSGPTDDPEAW
jgi:hypothetical protein